MARWELDSFYSKFKNLLCSEKDATLTFKSEAGRAFVTLSVDLGHVHSGQGQLSPGGPRNGPARQRRREKRAAARDKVPPRDNLKTKDVDSAEKVEEVFVNPDADQADRDNKLSSKNEQKTDAAEKVDEVFKVDNSDAEEAGRNEAAGKAAEIDDPKKETTANVEAKVMDVDDELCPDEMYTNETKDLKSLETPKLDCGANTTKKVVEYYTIHYEDYDNED